MRPSKKQYYLQIATMVSLRSTCIRRQYGAVIVKDDIIVATGYNGSPRGEVNCCDAGVCLRNQMNIPSGERYELCRSVHAEQNAIIQAGFQRTKGAILYLSGNEIGDDGELNMIRDPKPCKMCWRFIKNAGIEKVVTIGGTLHDENG